VLEQVSEGLAAEGLRVERRARAVGRNRPDRVDAADEAPDPLQRGGVAQLGRASAAAREDGEAETAELVQGPALDRHGRHHRHLALGQLGHEGVFLEDGVIAPAPRAVELGHHRRAILAADLVDPVLVAVQGQQAAVAIDADALQGVEHAVRVESGEGVRARRRRGR